MLFVADVGWSRVRVSRVGERGGLLASISAVAKETLDEVLGQLLGFLEAMGCAAGSKVAVAWNGVVSDRGVVSSARGTADVAAWLTARLGAQVRVWNDAHAAGWCAVHEHRVRDGVIAVIGSSLGRAVVMDGAVCETPGAGEILSVEGCVCGADHCLGRSPGGVMFERHVARRSGVLRTNVELREAYGRDGAVREAWEIAAARFSLSVLEPALLIAAPVVMIGGSFGEAWFDVLAAEWLEETARLSARSITVPELRRFGVGGEEVQRGLARLVLAEGW